MSSGLTHHSESKQNRGGARKEVRCEASESRTENELSRHVVQTRRPGRNPPCRAGHRQAQDSVSRAHTSSPARPLQLEKWHMRKQGSSYTLTFEDAIQVWHRHWDGEFQHRIAATFDVNPGRISEVLNEHKH